MCSFPEQKGILKGVAAERKARDHLRAALSADPLFAGCKDEYLKALVASFQTMKVEEAAQVLFGFTDPAKHLYFVAKGQVCVCRPPPLLLPPPQATVQGVSAALIAATNAGAMHGMGVRRTAHGMQMAAAAIAATNNNAGV